MAPSRPKRRRKGNSSPFSRQIDAMNSDLSKENQERTETLKNLDLFVLDNSLRETTVGQLRGHTPENKRKIFEQVSLKSKG